jgi:hypothetical protein
MRSLVALFTLLASPRQLINELEVQPRVPQPVSGNGLLLAAAGLRVTHIRRRDGRDFTVAYKPRRAKTHNLEIAVANRNPSDVFSRRLGTQQAVANFNNGDTILVPPIEDLGDVELIQATFFGGPYDITRPTE